MTSGDRDDPGVSWLVAHADPAVQALVHADLLAEEAGATNVSASSVVGGLLAGLTDAGATRRPYAKWGGARWRLISLVELGLAPGRHAAVDAADMVLSYWADAQRLAAVPVVESRARRCASQEGNAVAVACRLGLADDDRVGTLVQHLIGWQWPDGGWNCDERPAACHSSFHETLPALWGLHEYEFSTGDTSARAAVTRASELLLDHHVVFSTTTGQPIHPSMTRPHYPPYWHYDVLQALLVLHRAGFGSDPRTERAREMVRRQRRPDGTWRPGRAWWRRPGSRGGDVEVVDWGDVAHQMVTLNALRVGAGA